MLQDLAAYTVVGLTLGGTFALAALGIVVVYRITGVLNFANGAMGMFSTFVAWHFVYRLHQNVWLAVAAALLFSLLMGLVLELGVFHWLRNRDALTKAVVTIGILLALQAGASLIWGNNAYHEAITFPRTQQNAIVLFHIPVSWTQVMIVAAAIGIAFGLGAFLRLTRLGIAMRALSEDPTTASLWGVPVAVVGSLSWMIGSLVAAIAGILITPFINFDTVSLTVLVIDAMAAALIGGLVSLPLTVAGGFLLGLLETYPKIWLPQSLGFPKLVALVVILAVLLVRAPKALATRRA
jgi:branched-subunit amino acid ABC-type transport system permease component